MIKIAICDDNERDLLATCNFLEKYRESELCEHRIVYIAFSGSVELLTAIANGQAFDIFLLDIVMPLTNGIRLAEEIRESGQKAKIIFLSSTSAFAVESYQVEAFYYILKPIKEDVLFGQLTKAIQSIVEEQNRYIIVKKRNELIKIRFNQIQYAEIVEHTIHLYLRDGELITNFGTMSQLEHALCRDPRFIKPHRSYLLNMDFVENISPDGIRTTTGKHIPISRTVYKKIRQTYLDYSFLRR